MSVMAIAQSQSYAAAMAARPPEGAKTGPEAGGDTDGGSASAIKAAPGADTGGHLDITA